MYAMPAPSSLAHTSRRASSSGVSVMAATLSSDPPGSASSNHFVSAQQQRLRHRQTQCSCGHMVDYEFVLCGLLHRHIGRLRALQDAIDRECGAPEEGV